MLKSRFSKYIAQKPELEPGYNSILKGFILFVSVPWLIFVVGNLTGQVHNQLEYLNLKSGNPIVLLFHVAVALMVITYSAWVLFGNGATFMEQHPGLFERRNWGASPTPLTAKQIKMKSILLLAICAIITFVSWNGLIPVQDMRY